VTELDRLFGHKWLNDVPMIVRQENPLNLGQGKERIVNERNEGEERRKYDNKRGYEGYKAEKRTVKGNIPCSADPSALFSGWYLGPLTGLVSLGK
jgi:hypothetical protein